MPKCLSLLDNQNRIEAIAAGIPPIQIASEAGISRQAVSDFKKKHAEEIKAAAEEILAKTKTWVKRDIALIDKADSLLADDNALSDGTVPDLTGKQVKQIDVATKLKENYYRSIGIFNSHTPSTVFNQFNIVAGVGAISPIIQALLGQVPAQSQDQPDDSIPAEITEIMQD